MPVKKKPVSSKKRKEIRDAANSIPGLIIEHVSFEKNEPGPSDQKNTKSPHKYMLSNEKRLEHQKKRLTVFIGVGVVVLALVALWVVNVRTFFFDTKHTLSNEEQLIDKIKKNFDNTVGLVSEARPTFSSTTETKAPTPEALKAAVLAGLLSASSSTSTALSSTTTPLELISTSTMNTIPTTTPSST